MARSKMAACRGLMFSAHVSSNPADPALLITSRVHFEPLRAQPPRTDRPVPAGGGGFVAAWSIGCGLVQALAQQFVKKNSDGLSRRVQRWGMSRTE
jgi:hypothetical protein